MYGYLFSKKYPPYAPVRLLLFKFKNLEIFYNFEEPSSLERFCKITSDKLPIWAKFAKDIDIFRNLETCPHI